MRLLIPLSTVLGSVLAMEAVAWGLHRWVMHGPGWWLHRSHHEPRSGPFELNDLYALVFVAAALALLAFGGPPGEGVAWWAGVGVTLYGVLYALVHDGLTHRRWPMPRVQPRGYLGRLVQAHRLHHAVRTRDGAVSFGFLYAPPVDRLKAQLRSAARRRTAGAVTAGAVTGGAVTGGDDGAS